MIILYNLWDSWTVKYGFLFVFVCTAFEMMLGVYKVIYPLLSYHFIVSVLHFLLSLACPCISLLYKHSLWVYGSVLYTTEKYMVASCYWTVYWNGWVRKWNVLSVPPLHSGKKCGPTGSGSVCVSVPGSKECLCMYLFMWIFTCSGGHYCVFMVLFHSK